jgi:hypothetical protein
VFSKFLQAGFRSRGQPGIAKGALKKQNRRPSIQWPKKGRKAPLHFEGGKTKKSNREPPKKTADACEHRHRWPIIVNSGPKSCFCIKTAPSPPKAARGLFREAGQPPRAQLRSVLGPNKAMPIRGRQPGGPKATLGHLAFFFN